MAANPYEPPRGEVDVPVPGPFTALDWIGVVITALAMLATCALSLAADAFAGMYRDMGATSLPLLTRLALRPWLGPVFAAAPAALVILAIWKNRRLSLGLRRALVVVAFCLALAAGAIVLYGLYLPIFELAGAVRAE